MHACDVPICVHVDTGGVLAPVVYGDHRLNMLDWALKLPMRTRQRSAGAVWAVRSSPLDRVSCAMPF